MNIVSTVEEGTPERVSCLWQDWHGMQKDQPLQGGVQVSVETVAGQETTKEFQVNP